MKTVRWTSVFKADYKKVSRLMRYHDTLNHLQIVTQYLLEEQSLPEHFRDHPLSGEWKGCRECHLLPDMLLIYRLEGEATIAFAQLGTHSELFG